MHEVSMRLQQGFRRMSAPRIQQSHFVNETRFYAFSHVEHATKDAYMLYMQLFCFRGGLLNMSERVDESSVESGNDRSERNNQ